ncbi:MAG: type IV pilus twitching motility protein PilT [Verrucomicrobiales bacterium]|nr:type IV pilus twitching motility protein PilT [Verrucomicrobiales bacterium]
MSDFTHALHVLSEVFTHAGDFDISDIQLRTDRIPYIHTKKGLMVIHSLGELPEHVVRNVIDMLYANQDVDKYASQQNQLVGQMDVIERLQEYKVADFSCNGQMMPNGELSGRMRVQAHLSSSGLGVTCRILADDIPNLEVLGLGTDTIDALKGFLQKRQGMGLVTGQTGSGKSTTLAALLDWVRRNCDRHIVTVEDPIEYRYPHDMTGSPPEDQDKIPPGIVTQQEVGKHVMSYHQGLKDVLRKAPHVILLGEVRDRDTMDTVIEAAQTGHVVITTLHTNGAVKTISRILEFFPRDQHKSILGRLSEILMFILSQGLMKGLDGRVLNYEFLQNTSSAVRSGIAAYDGGAKSLEDVLRQSGNIEWDDNLRNLYNAGKIDFDTFQLNMMNLDDDDANLFIEDAAFG